MSSLVLVVVSYSTLFVFSIAWVRWLAQEDGIVEYIGATMFLMASIIFFLNYKRSRQIQVFKNISFKGNVFYLLLGLAFLFVFLEEVSWGQRIIGFQAPENIRELNAQGEFNIHNLRIFHGTTETGEKKSFWGLLLNMDRLFSIFWFSFCCLIPVFYRLSSSTRRFLDRIQMPIVPMSLGLIFVLSYAVTKFLELILDSRIQDSIVEIKETNLAMLFFILAIWFLHTNRYPVSDASATS